VAIGGQMGNAFAGAAGAPGVVTPGNTTPPGAAHGAGGPPPLPGAVAFHASIDGASAGPFDLAALAAPVHTGKLNRNTLAWKTGMAGWTAAGTVPELQGLFADVPPPLPG